MCLPKVQIAFQFRYEYLNARMYPAFEENTYKELMCNVTNGVTRKNFYKKD